ncbi:SGNH/GDSL hydrolase family protein [Luteimonas sp. Y-2-2-4F]|nr:SGNH/GDSL hydrolase family protein [Luteimonas sp. Y-2-2-4F]MCD9031184.1 SGNH/GDSL hydrolase family protein [Luteimonas sp. Y-2-2-4F]
MTAGALPVLALGDSYTIGEGVAPDGRWPVQLARALREAGLPAGEPQIVAATGWTTDELDAAIDAADPQGPFDLVTLLIGVNDQYRGHDVDEYRARYDALLLRAIGFAGGRADRVLALSIPDWGVTPYGQASGRDPAAIARDIDAYNATAGERCATHGTGWVDVAPVSRARGAHPSMLAEDGLHPSAAMYAEWTALALPEARRLLGAEPGSA